MSENNFHILIQNGGGKTAALVSHIVDELLARGVLVVSIEPDGALKAFKTRDDWDAWYYRKNGKIAATITIEGLSNGDTAGLYGRDNEAPQPTVNGQVISAADAKFARFVEAALEVGFRRPGEGPDDTLVRVLREHRALMRLHRKVVNATLMAAIVVGKGEG